MFLPLWAAIGAKIGTSLADEVTRDYRREKLDAQIQQARYKQADAKRYLSRLEDMRYESGVDRYAIDEEIRKVKAYIAEIDDAIYEANKNFR